ncbi:MAG: helix-turn-helix domain-containing protein [Proteobacteria bacterium]|nr:helix-turn-helix domain-containing protein [Pseudomonadota bacterium]
MIIPDLLAQRIVDTATCLVHCNVNIMDREGVIIGTAQPDRRRTFHKGALDVVESGFAVEIYPGEVPLYPGAREGVNLPISLDGQTVGVIGVTGDPDKVRSIARLTKMITELILERELLHQETQSRLRLAEHLVELLLWGGPTPAKGRILRTAKALGLDLDLPRIVAVADISAQIARFRSQYGASELVLDRSSEAILAGLTGSGALAGQDVAVVLDERLIVLKHLPLDGAADAARQWGRQAVDCLGRLGEGTVCFGIGGLALSLAEYPPSYSQAIYSLMARGQALGQETDLRSIYDPALSVGYLLRELGAGAGGMILRPLAASLDRFLPRKPELKATIQALFDNRFELETTAFALGIHRNTLAYRLGRLKDLTGLDPVRRHDDATLLRAVMELRASELAPAMEARGAAGK